ncbi:MAG: hypothetical protein HY829_00845 [Actinobacteria bacterium]|nr:hypothetical protein [Actinomycetota bacterium]
MATTLANLRAKLNGEIGVTTDSETTPFSLATRNNAIADGYAALWRAGVWKPVQSDIATVTDQSFYTTTMRTLRTIDLLDSSSHVIGHPKGRIEPDGAGGYKLVLTMPISTGSTMRVYGFTAYVSTFASDSASDDLDAEYNRIPVLKAKAIVYRSVLGLYARYGSRQVAAPVMNATVEQILGIVAAAEREFDSETKALAAMRDRSMQPKSGRPI